MASQKVYQTFKYNRHLTHFLDDFGPNKEKAICSAKTLHHPDWPCWQGITVTEFTNGRAIRIFDSNMHK